MLRALVRAVAIAVLIALVLVVLAFAELLVWPSPGGASMAATIPSCDGRVVAEGLTYKLRDPRSGEVVAVHAAKGADDAITPDADARDLTLVLRVAARPGDQIVGRDGSVFVNGVKFDDIETAPFRRVDLGGDQYFLLGDNRSASIDSRTFGPVLEDTIFARALLVVWPLRGVGLLADRESGTPPGPTSCG